MTELYGAAQVVTLFNATVLVIGLCVAVYLGVRGGVRKSNKDLIESLQGEVASLSRRVKDSEEKLELAVARIQLYRGQIDTLLRFIQKGDVTGMAAVHAVARQLQDEDDRDFNARRSS